MTQKLGRLKRHDKIRACDACGDVEQTLQVQCKNGPAFLCADCISIRFDPTANVVAAAIAVIERAEAVLAHHSAGGF